MKKKISTLIVIALTACLFVTSYVGMVHATPPTSVLFGSPFDSFGGSPPEYIQAGESNTWFLHASTYGELIGDIEGSFTAEAHWIYHGWAGPVEDPLMTEVKLVVGHVLLTIDASVDEKTGTIMLKFIDDGHNVYAGTWVIYGGTGGLKGLHGKGTWVIPGVIEGVPCQLFEGQIHFDP
jgi:hypothetical protein